MGVRDGRGGRRHRPETQAGYDKRKEAGPRACSAES